jgi:hypothetical protein
VTIKKFFHSDVVYDVIIVGAGPAGISIALELEKKKIKVALIEAGKEEYNIESQDFYKGVNEGEFPQDLEVSRLRMFGGTTGHWGGTCRPLDPYDYDKWPIKKADLDMYLDQACEILEIKNEFREKNISNSSSLKIIEFQRSKIRFKEKYLSHIKKSKFIHLFLDTCLVNINSDDFVFKSADCLMGGTPINISSKFIIVAAGGIENSRILLIANSKNEKIFSPELPIGNYWYEHPFKALGNALVKQDEIKKNMESTYNHFINMFNAGNASTAYSIAPTEIFINKKKILNSCIWLVIHKRTNDNWKNISKNLFCIAPDLSNVFLNLIKKKVACGASLFSSWEQEAQFKNRIVLSENIKDLNDYPVAKIIYSKSQLVRKTAKTCFEEIGQYFVENNLGRVSGKSFLFDENQKYMSDAGWHHMGGTIMGSNRKNSVVDSNMKVHGSKNMYIAGSSVFPSGGHANPTLTIIQLSLRLANHLMRNFS